MTHDAADAGTTRCAGGSDNDTIELTSAGIGCRTSHALNVSDKCEKALLADGTNTLTLVTRCGWLRRAFAQAAGIVSVEGGAGNDAIDASTYYGWCRQLPLAMATTSCVKRALVTTTIAQRAPATTLIVSGTGNDDISLTSGENLIKFAHDAADCGRHGCWWH